MGNPCCWCGRVGKRLVYGEWRCDDHRPVYKIPSPPPDVVEAARRLNIQRFLGTEPDWDHIETVCKWVLNKAIDK